MSFHHDENALLTLHTSHTKTQETETVLSLWQTVSRRRVATARFAGQVLSAGWDDQGLSLALLRFNPELAKQAANRTGLWPWATPSTSPFLFHVWDVRMIPVAGEERPHGGH